MSNQPSNSHKLWLELLQKQSRPEKSLLQPTKLKNSSSDNFESNNKISYKSPEEYYDELLLLKKTIVTVKGENEFLKSKLRKAEDNLSKKEKEFSKFLESVDKMGSSGGSTGGNTDFQTNVAFMKMKQQISQLKSEISAKDSEIINLKSDMKYTKIAETKVQNEVYLQEIRNLKQIINSSLKQIPTMSVDDQIIDSGRKSTKTNERYKNLLKRNKELTTENKMLQKENYKLLHEKSSATEETKNIEQLKSDHNQMEVERLKKLCKELNTEKTNYQTKFEEMSINYKLLEEKYRAKQNETVKKTHSQPESTSKPSPSSSATTTTPPHLEVSHEAANYVRDVLLSYFKRNSYLETCANQQKLNPVDKVTEEIYSVVQGFISRKGFINRS